MRPGRVFQSLAVVGVLLLTASHTRADDSSATGMMAGAIGYENRGYGEPLTPRGLGIDRSTVGYEVIRQAASTNAQIYGAIGVFDRKILPTVDKLRTAKEQSSKSGGGVFFDFYSTVGVGNVTAVCGVPGTAIENEDSKCDGLARQYSADLYSISAAGVWGDGNKGFFAAASYSLAMIPGPAGSAEGVGMRGVYFGYLGLLAVGGMPIYRLLGKKVFNWLMPGSADGMIGGYYALGPIHGYAGYVLSQGVFGDVSVPKLNMFVSTAVAQEFHSLALLRGGFRHFDYFENKDLVKKIGYTSLFARQVKIITPRSVALPGGDSINELKQISFLSGHIEQSDISSIVDVRLAYAFIPQSVVHDARVGIHTPMYRRASVTSSSQEESSKNLLGWGGGITAGRVSLPNLYYYGAKGGPRFSFTAEAGYIARDMKFLTFVRMNDPEFLISFPYAYDALNIGLQLMGAWN